MGYEVRDVNYKLLRKIIIGFFIFAGLSAAFAGIYIFGFPFGWFGFRGVNPQYAFGKWGFETVRKVPAAPNPLVQSGVSAKVEISEMRYAEDEVLKSTGYVGPNKAMAHIPIGQAMDLLAERGIPKGSETAAVSKGNVDNKIRIDETVDAGAAAAEMQRQEAAAEARNGSYRVSPGDMEKAKTMPVTEEAPNP
jgi:hypothetical protein